jgi:hypothetical protein
MELNHFTGRPFSQKHGRYVYFPFKIGTSPFVNHFVEFQNLKPFDKNELIDEENKDREQSRLQEDAQQIAADCEAMFSNEGETVGKFDTTLPERRDKESVEASSS